MPGPDSSNLQQQQQQQQAVAFLSVESFCII
jgi:hypothetical protein